MAGDKVRRGFLFYVMMLLLFVVAIFFILVVIMVFNPGMNLLGMKYFSNIRDYRVVEVMPSGQNVEYINLSNATDIVVDGNLINFEILRDQNIEHTTVEIENYQTGFAESGQNSQFSYSVEYSLQENSRYLLDINVTNAEGFLYFNNNCYVRILLPKDETLNSTNTLTVSTEKGSIILGGGQALLDENDSYFNFRNVNLQTDSGNIRFGEYLETNFSQLSINNQSGSFRTAKDVVLEDNATLNITGQSGSFEFANITKASTTDNALINFNLSSGSFSAENVDCDINLKTTNSTVNIQNLSGNLQANDLVNKMDGANLTIGQVAGSISLPFANNSNITIDDASQAEIFINSNNAQIDIGKLAAGSWLETKQGSINVSLADTSGDINLVSESANINIDGNTQMQNSVNANSVSGSVVLNYNPQSSFTVEFYNSQGQAREDVEAEGYENTFSNPLVVNGGGVRNTISTNGNISLRRL